MTTTTMDMVAEAGVGEVETFRHSDPVPLDVQITTAKRYPRSLARFSSDCMEMATSTEDIAEECMYALPRDGKTIEGPSARLGEIVLSAWGNCKAGARIEREDGQFVYAMGYFFDTQRNVQITREVRRRIVDKYNRRYNTDMIAVTGNAACAIAQRNAVFAGIPKAFWNSTYTAVRKVIAGDLKTLASRRAETFAWMAKRGVDEPRILAALGKVGVEDVGLEDFVTLKGMVNSVKDGEATIDEMFPDPRAAERAAEKSKRGVAGLKEKVGKGSAASDGSGAAVAEGAKDRAKESAGDGDPVEGDSAGASG